MHPELKELPPRFARVRCLKRWFPHLGPRAQAAYWEMPKARCGREESGRREGTREGEGEWKQKGKQRKHKGEMDQAHWDRGSTVLEEEQVSSCPRPSLCAGAPLGPRLLRENCRDFAVFSFSSASHREILGSRPMPCGKQLVSTSYPPQASQRQSMQTSWPHLSWDGLFGVRLWQACCELQSGVREFESTGATPRFLSNCRSYRKSTNIVVAAQIRTRKPSHCHTTT